MSDDISISVYLTALKRLNAQNADLLARIAELEAALKQSHDVMHELMAIIPGNDKGAIEATTNAIRVIQKYLGEKE